MKVGPKIAVSLLIKYAPSPLKEDVVNIALILMDDHTTYVRITNRWDRVRALDPHADVDLLKATADDLLAQLRDPHRREQCLQMMRSSFSNSLQLSDPVRCLLKNPKRDFATLAAQLL